MTYKVGDKVTIQDVNGELVDVTIEELHSLGMGKIYYQAGKRLFTDENVASIPPQRHSSELRPSVECGTVIVSEPETNERAKVLSEAERLINGDRAKDYGDPETNFGRLANLWNAQFAHKLNQPLTAQDVAYALIHLKMSRLANTPGHRDSLIDVCGYAALSGELK